MSAIAGIIGEGSSDEVRTMVMRMSYRGLRQQVWSPAPNVYFGVVGHDVDADSGGPIVMTTPARQMIDADAPFSELAGRLNRDLAGGLRSLHGSFAFAVLGDSAGTSVVLAVDQMADRSLYVMRLPGRWIFASEYKALLSLSECRAQVDRDALQFYLVHGECRINSSLLFGAQRLARGQMMRLHPSGESATASYVDTGVFDTVGRRPSAAIAIRQKLESIVIRQLQGHMRLALTLSAGFDSTSLLALVRHVRPDIKISSYTIGSGPDDPEIVGARRSAEYFNTEHHEVFFANSELERLLPEYVWLTENLIGRGEAIMQQQIAFKVAQKDKLVMAGHGADMLFCGMPRHRLLWLGEQSPPPIRGALHELLEYTQIRTVPRSWLGRRLVRLAQGESAAAGFGILGARPPVWPEQLKTLDGYRREYAYCGTFAYHEPALERGGLTMLSPYSDVQIRDIALGLPHSSLISARGQKLILREAMADLLPDFLLRRPKAIQRLRQDGSLSDTLSRLAESLDLDRSLADRGLIARDSANAVLRGHVKSYSRAALNDLWGLICAELWMRTFCDGRGAAPASTRARTASKGTR